MCRALLYTLPLLFLSFFPFPTLIPAVGWIPPSDPPESWRKERERDPMRMGSHPFLLLYGIADRERIENKGKLQWRQHGSQMHPYGVCGDYIIFLYEFYSFFFSTSHCRGFVVVEAGHVRISRAQVEGKKNSMFLFSFLMEKENEVLDILEPISLCFEIVFLQQQQPTTKR